jgi:hypothetical protein
MSVLDEVGIHENVPHEEYLALRALSQGSIKTLLDCPARYAWELEHPREVGAAADLGSVVHGLVLGSGPGIVKIDADDWRTKAAQQQRDSAKADGLVPILASAYDEAMVMAEAVLAHPKARALLEAEGDAELSMRWNHLHDEEVIPFRGRIDKVSYVDAAAVLVDLKTARSASPREFVRAVFNYGYHVQHVVYQDGWQALTGYEPDFQFIVVESARPYLTAVYRLDEVAVEYGWQQVTQALDTYLACSRSGFWPGYGGDETVTLDSPRWVKGSLRFGNSEADF